MTSEQLQQTRAERWRHSTNPLLTAEDAQEWLTGVGFCLYLPRRAQTAAPAPSFVEAVMGAVTDAPPRETIEQAAALLRRLAADGAVVPLNLMGAGGGFAAGASDAPDFLSTRETLPYVFSLIGGRNWKSGPGAKASPLMTGIWTLLNDGGAARTAQEIQSGIAGEPSESAVLRALVELWNGLRVLPVYSEDATRWELTQARFAAEMTASQKIAQTTSLSVLVSLYLESAIAASTDEIESFLSPLAARSRVREVVNGLQATRQLGLTSVAAQPLLHIAGALPEFDEEPTESVAEAKTRPESEASAEPASETEARPGMESRAEYKPFRRERKPFERETGKSFPRGERKPYPHKERFAAQGREERREPERDGVHKRPFEKRAFEKKPFERGCGTFGKKTFGPRSEERGEQGRPPYAGRTERPQQEGRGFGGKKQFGAKRPFFGDRNEGPEGRKPREYGSGFHAKRREGERPAWHEGERPAKREGGWKPKGGFAGRDKPGFKRDGEQRFQSQQRPEFRREGGSRPNHEGKPEFRREGKPEFRRERESGPDRKGRGGFRRPGSDGEHKRFDRPARPFAKFAKSSERPSKPYGKPGKSSGRYSKGPDKGPRSFGRPGKPFGKGKPHFGKPGFDKPSFGKPGFKKREFGKPGRSGFGARKPGGFKPPARKRKPEEHGDAE